MGWHDHRGHSSSGKAEAIPKTIAEMVQQDTKTIVKTELGVVPKDINSYVTLPVNHTRRVYNNGDYVDNGVLEEHLMDHITYNTTMRFGCALFINGKCIYCGYLSIERCEAIEKELARIQPIVSPSVVPYA